MLFSPAQMRAITILGMIITIIGSLWLAGSVGILIDNLRREVGPKITSGLCATVTVYDHRGVIDSTVGLSSADMITLQDALREYENVKGD